MKKNDIIKNFLDNNPKILVVGDIFLDSYIIGESNRVSPEKPVPVINYIEDKYYLGGAGNVATILANLKSNVTLIGAIGKDKNAKIIKKILGKNKIIFKGIEDKEFNTIVKNRIFSNDTQLGRIDYENKNIVNLNHSIIKDKFNKEINNADIVIFSDYNKGVLEKIKDLIKITKKNKKVCIVDPKKINLQIYKGADILKPNEKEFNNYIAYSNEKINNYNFNSLGCKNLIISKGSNGIELITKNSKYFSKANKKNIFDVTGAGDYLAALLAFFKFYNIELKDIINIANNICSIAISNNRSYKFTKLEAYTILNEYFKWGKVFNLPDLSNICKLYQNSNKKIVFTNGCFDIFHSGHLKLLNKAKNIGDVLVVAINSDNSVKINKGKTRPIIKLKERIELLKNLKSVDIIISFNEKTPIKLIKKIIPDFLIKGSDYKLKDIIGYSFLKSKNKKIVNIKIENKISSSKIINLIKKT